MSGIDFAKGHGTQNDFVILPDPAAAVPLTTEWVTALCDRRRGLGADGVLRVARTGTLIAQGVLSARPAGVDDDDWFMDYRNADGSVAEMCGNGVRVFAHFLRAQHLVSDDEFVVGSRAGGRRVTIGSWDAEHAQVSVAMGAVTVGDYSVATVGTRGFRGLAVDVGNPHLACVADDFGPEALAAVDFSAGVDYDHDVFPQGVNVEILTAPLDDAVNMRVYERGSGETRSCGTGTVAAVAAALDSRGHSHGQMTVRVRGGQVQVAIEGGEATLTGPSELVATGTLGAGWGG